METIENTVFIGRSNPFNLKNWLEISGLETIKKINITENLIENYIKNNYFQKINIVFLQEISTKDWESSINVNFLPKAQIQKKLEINLMF